jgi:hypothetical protein
MACTLDIDPVARAQIWELPPAEPSRSPKPCIRTTIRKVGVRSRGGQPW